MPLSVDLQLASTASDIPAVEDFERWASSALQQPEGELVIRIVDNEECRILNRDYRGKDRPTNVLSFPFEAPQHLPSNYLGDLIICAPVVVEEAREQEKVPDSHWAHMTIHGMLHLQGYDHLDEDEANEMEQLECRIMAELGYPNPYQLTRQSAQ